MLQYFSIGIVALTFLYLASRFAATAYHRQSMLSFIVKIRKRGNSLPHRISAFLLPGQCAENIAYLTTTSDMITARLAEEATKMPRISAFKPFAFLYDANYHLDALVKTAATTDETIEALDSIRKCNARLIN